MSWLNDLIAKLEGDGVGTFGQNIFATTMAGVPVLASGEATLQITVTGGTGPEHTHNSTIRPAYVQPAAQLTARADAYEDAHAMAQAAYDSLTMVRNEFLVSGGSWYAWIKALQEPFDGGVDERGQVRVQFNVIAKKRP